MPLPWIHGVWSVERGTEVLRRVIKKAPSAAGNTMPSTIRAQAATALQLASAPPKRPRSEAAHILASALTNYRVGLLYSVEKDGGP